MTQRRLSQTKVDRSLGQPGLRRFWRMLGAASVALWVLLYVVWRLHG